MKKILVVISMFIIASAQASEIKIFDKSWYEIGFSRSISQHFVTNEELGRAWVEVDVADQDLESMGSTYRVKVDGLSYDVETKTVLLEVDGQSITCAKFVTKGRSIFKTSYLKITDNCSFKGSWRKIIYDNGFEMKETQKYSIVLIVE